MFQTDICFLKQVFLFLSGLRNQFYLDLLDQSGLCLDITNIGLKHNDTNHLHIYDFITKICLTKQTLCFTKQCICLNQTEPNRVPNKASVYVCSSIYSVMPQTCFICSTDIPNFVVFRR